MIFEYSILWFLAALAVVFVATFIQTSTGLGFAMIAMPALAILEPSLVPGPALLLMLVLSSSMAVSGRFHLCRTGLFPLLSGMVIGVVLGGSILASVESSAINLILAGTILLALALSFMGYRFARSTMTFVLFGLASGAVGTITGMHGPVLAILYQNYPNFIARATIAAIFVVGATMSLVSLVWIGHFAQEDLRDVLVLLPGVMAGYLLARSRFNKISERSASIAMTGIAALSAITLIAREVAKL